MAVTPANRCSCLSWVEFMMLEAVGSQGICMWLVSDPKNSKIVVQTPVSYFFSVGARFIVVSLTRDQ